MRNFLFLFILFLEISSLSGCSLLHKSLDKMLIQVASLDDDALLQLLSAKPVDPGKKALREDLLSLSKHAQVNISQMLIDSGAQVNARNAERKTPLMLAADNDRESLAALFILKGAKLELTDHNGQTAKTLAESKKNQNTLSVLWYAERLKSPPDISSVNRLLHDACVTGSVGAVGLLLDKGADVNSTLPDNPNSIPLLLASMLGHQETMRLLLDRGADINTTDTDGQNALCLAVSSYTYAVNETEYLDTLRLLLDHKVAVDKAARGGEYNALSLAIKLNQTAAVELLLDNGADPNIIDADNHTALALATRNRNEDIIKALINHGADVNAVTADGKTALSYAESGTIISQLVKNGANINHIDRNGDTILMKAVKNGSIELVKACMQNGADIGIVDKGGQTALELASEPIIQILKAAENGR